MGTGTARSALVSACLLALVFLGSPGCGCSDDLPDTPGEEERECCCEFEWIMEQTNLPPGATIDILLLNVDPTLQAVARPAQLVGVNPGQPQLFDVCVQDDHAIGASLTIEFRDSLSNQLMGSANLVYNARCIPDIVPLTQRLFLTSTDCAGTCCCTITWEVTDRNLTNATVDLTLAGASLGVNATVTPDELTDVSFGDLETFQICLNDDHPVPASVTVEASVGVTPVWTVTFSYQQPCIVTVPVGPDLPLLWTEDCGEVPTCCCDFLWTVGDPDWGTARTVSVEISNQTPGLGATVNCTQCDGVGPGATVPAVPAEFTVCVPWSHAAGATVEIIIRDSADNAQVDLMTLTYDNRCFPTLTEIPNQPPADRGTFSTVGCGGNGLVDVMQK